MDGTPKHSQDTQDPFVHVFARDGRWLAYDVNTNVILTLEPVLAHLLRNSWEADFSAAEVLEAKDALKTGQTEGGLFLPGTRRSTDRGPLVVLDLPEWGILENPGLHFKGEFVQLHGP